MVKAYQPRRDDAEARLKTITPRRDPTDDEIEVEHEIYVRRYPQGFEWVEAEVIDLGEGRPSRHLGRTPDAE